MMTDETRERAWWAKLDIDDPKCVCGHRRSAHGPNQQTTYTICSLGRCNVACERFSAAETK